MADKSVSAIASLRRAEAILRASGDPAGLAVADGLQSALAGKRRLDLAVGLIRHGGAGGVACVTARAHRDTLLRDLRGRYFLLIDTRPAARAILDLASRRQRARGPAPDDASALLDEILAYGPLPGERQVARILDIQDPIWMS